MAKHKGHFAKTGPEFEAKQGTGFLNQGVVNYIATYSDGKLRVINEGLLEQSYRITVLGAFYGKLCKVNVTSVISLLCPTSRKLEGILIAL